MFQPKRVKFRKVHRGRRKGVATTGNLVEFGDFGLKALEPHWITAKQIEAARVAIGRNLKKGGRMWIRIYPDKSVTKKPAETRMGGGKAPVEHWVAVVKPGRIMFEVGGISRDDAVEALRLASHKLPIPTRVVTRVTLQVASTQEE